MPFWKGQTEVSNRKSRKKKNTERSFNKLEKKRKRVQEFIKSKNCDFDESWADRELLQACYKYFGKKLPRKKLTVASASSRFSSVLYWAKIKPEGGIPTRSYSESGAETPEQFYRCFAWRRLRYELLQKYEARCQCCGMSAKDGVVIHVDHIKPIKLHWHLKLEIDNLQVLCELCNHGKGSKYTDDWRPGEPANSDN